jgi:hypothetical protein
VGRDATEALRLSDLLGGLTRRGRESSSAVSVMRRNGGNENEGKRKEEAESIG